MTVPGAFVDGVLGFFGNFPLAANQDLTLSVPPTHALSFGSPVGDSPAISLNEMKCNLPQFTLSSLNGPDVKRFSLPFQIAVS